MKAYEIGAPINGLAQLNLVDHPEPNPESGQVTVKMHAASLNARDIQILKGIYGVQPKVPLSDGAGEVVAVAPGVTRVKVGDRVATIFRQTHLAGDLTSEKAKSALGGEQEGVLAERLILHEDGLVKIPDELSYEEAATLPCAAVTAWNALVVEAKIKAGDTVLLLGTGGVSIFALQFAKMMGANVIITSSSDGKLERAQALGADGVINYRTTPDWDTEVLRLTAGRGVDIVLELGGSATLSQSLQAVRVSGQVEVIGVINGIKSEVNVASILGKHVRVQGISVGSRDSFENMNVAIAQNLLHPVIDKVFPFEKANDAVTYLASGEHFGKVVIKF
jgi:NADPH:quinone reductase-like Zn-dependent oxidoreductase